MAPAKKARATSAAGGRKRAGSAAGRKAAAPSARKRAAASSRAKRAVGASGLPKPATDAAGFPERIYAVASPHSIGGVSLFTPGVLADSSTVANFVSEEDVLERAIQELNDAGFEILQATPIMINIAGDRRTFERAVRNDARCHGATRGEGRRRGGHRNLLRHYRHAGIRSHRSSQLTARRSARGGSDRAAVLLADSQRLPAARQVLASGRARGRVARLQCRQGTPHRYHRNWRPRGDGRYGPVRPSVLQSARLPG